MFANKMFLVCSISSKNRGRLKNMIYSPTPAIKFVPSVAKIQRMSQTIPELHTPEYHRNTTFLLPDSLDFHIEAKRLSHSEDILVAAPAHVHHQQVVFGQGRRKFHHMGKRVGWLQGRDDPFQLA